MNAGNEIKRVPKGESVTRRHDSDLTGWPRSQITTGANGLKAYYFLLWPKTPSKRCVPPGSVLDASYTTPKSAIAICALVVKRQATISETRIF